MAKNTLDHICSSCGYTTAKWMGFCPQCRTHGSLTVGRPHRADVVPLGARIEPVERVTSGLDEVDRVLGGGFVPGSVTLIGGEPGVGKSTMLLQLAHRVATAHDALVLYVSGEESVGQISLRAERLGCVDERILIQSTGSFADISDTLEDTKAALVVVDSVQTMRSEGADGAPGGVSQVRAAGSAATSLARSLNVPIVLVGHVTKDGHLAGPKVLEHLVDVTILLEGDVDRGLRYVRSIKNRHGSIDQVGVFEMGEAGLTVVDDPASVFVSGWTGGVPGTVLYPAMFGRRTMLVEVQALVSPTTAPQPRRSVKGVPPARVNQLLAVLDRHCGISCVDRDVFVNVVGGLSLTEPAADLAIALAVASSRTGRPLGPVAAFGEIGLVGEIRRVSHHGRRLGEVERFGVAHLVAPPEFDVLATALATLDLGRRQDSPHLVPAG